MTKTFQTFIQYLRGSSRLEFWILVIRICFGFCASCFGFLKNRLSKQFPLYQQVISLNDVALGGPLKQVPAGLPQIDGVWKNPWPPPKKKKTPIDLNPVYTPLSHPERRPLTVPGLLKDSIFQNSYSIHRSLPGPSSRPLPSGKRQSRC